MLMVTGEQRWAFELDGYLHLPGLLLQATSRASSSARGPIAEHPGLLAAIEQLAGGEVPLHGRAGPPLPSGTPSGELQEFHTTKFQLDRPLRSLPAGEGRWANELTVDEHRRL